MIRQNPNKESSVNVSKNSGVSSRAQGIYGKRLRCSDNPSVKAVKVRKWSQHATSNLGINNMKTLLSSLPNGINDNTEGVSESHIQNFASTSTNKKDFPVSNLKQTQLFSISQQNIQIPFKRSKSSKRNIASHINCSQEIRPNGKKKLSVNNETNISSYNVSKNNVSKDTVKKDIPLISQNVHNMVLEKQNDHSTKGNFTLLNNFSLLCKNNSSITHIESNGSSISSQIHFGKKTSTTKTNKIDINLNNKIDNIIEHVDPSCNQLMNGPNSNNSNSKNAVISPNINNIHPSSQSSIIADKTGSSTKTSFCSPLNDNLKDFSINSFIVLPKDREILKNKVYTSSLRTDSAAYGQDWLCFHKHKEPKFEPWQVSMTGKLEKLRLGVISMYWNSASIHPISPATIHVAINNFSRLLHYWHKSELEHPSAAKWALTAVVAFRLAFKAEERPEVVWEVSNFWNIFPMFNDWDIDRSEENINKVELEALRALSDSMDVPLAPMFLSLYIAAAGWPEELTKDYHELGLYLIALTTFASIKDNLLRNIRPSRIAAAALVLSVKIINGDRASTSGILSHLKACPYPSLSNESYKKKNENRNMFQTPNSTVTTAATVSYTQNGQTHSGPTINTCICRYEFYPERLRVYSGFSLEELLPVIKGLSSLLRCKPSETCVLNHFFPIWADNDWQ